MTTPSHVLAMLDRLAEKTGVRPTRNGNKFVTRCPSHGDEPVSLTVGIGERGNLDLNCDRCEPWEVLHSLGLPYSSLFPVAATNPNGDDRQRSGRIDAATVKSAARGRWRDVLTSVGGLNNDSLDGRHHPCPRCGGDDRFRLIDEQAGAVLCNQCFSKANGDGFAAIQWLNNWTFSQALKAVAEHLGVKPVERKPGDIVLEVARLKRMPLESFKAFGAASAKRGRLTVARVPMFDAKLQPCSNFDMALVSPDFEKGMSEKGKPVGLFVTIADPPKPGDVVLVTEGVKDSAALHSLGFKVVGLPTCKMAAKFARVFAGCHVVIVPDRDTTGEDSAKITAASLKGVAASVRIATLPGELKATDGNGVREVLAMKDGEVMLRQAVADAVSWETATENGAESGTGDKSANLATLGVQNFKWVVVETENGEEEKPEPLPIITIANTIAELTGNWPRRVGASLFVPNVGRAGISWLPDADSLFGYLGQATKCPPRFKATDGFHTKRELFAFLIRTVTEYVAVEELPHEPLIPGHFYVSESLHSGDGAALRSLVSRFSPETEIDADLLLAAFVTPFWGGTGGTRPAICITSDAGKGCGKSTLAACIGQLAGGALDVSANEDIAAIKARLLSPEGISKRVVWLDNVKSHRLSWAELESLITSPVISGKRMYVGEGQRPNALTFVLTMNGVSLSTDMAQRSVIIKLKRPDYSGTWADETRQFVESHRHELVADALGFLRSTTNALAKFSRWGDWERDILSRLPEPSEAQAIIRERQIGVDVDGEESSLIEEFFSQQLASLGYDIKSNRVFIPSRVAARWLGWATNERQTVAKASRTLKQRITESQIRRLLECGRRDIGRGFEFWGDDSTGQTYLHRDLEDQIRIRGERHVE